MTDDETTRIRAIAEALADVLEERGVFAAPTDQPSHVLNAVQVGRLLGRDRRWVYAHAEELAAFDTPMDRGRGSGSISR